jgi:hypothetical protein
MPLILPAIDLEFSPSPTEVKAKKKYLDSQNSIIQHSEALYDITNFVAIGTNQILRLAHEITQDLSSNVQPPEVFVGDITLDHTFCGSCFQPTKPSLTISSRPPRPTSWQDTSIRCPRAYLLLLTAVDYSLVIGRPPSASILPDMVPDILGMGVVMRLPWNSRIPLYQFQNRSLPHDVCATSPYIGGRHR